MVVSDVRGDIDAGKELVELDRRGASEENNG
jgi:hypothetical protein